MPDTNIEPHASYRSMADGTKEDYDLVFEHFKVYERDLASRVLKTVAQLEQSYPGELVNRLVHSLQTATRAHRDGHDEEYVVAALLDFDVGGIWSERWICSRPCRVDPSRPVLRPNTLPG